jgi:integrase
MSRRGHGEGSIYQRADGRWCATLDLGTVNGKRRRKVRYARTRKEAAEKLRQMQQEAESGVDLAAERQTVAAFLNTWLEQVVRQNNRPKTYAAYSSACTYYIIPYIGHIQLDKLRAQHVQQMLNSLSGHVSTTTVRYARTVLVVALNQAVKWGYISRNVAALVDSPPAQPYEAEPLTEEQAARFLAATRGHRNEPLYRVALGVGLRIGEIIALKWSDVDREQGYLRVRQGKSKNARRSIKLPDQLVQVLNEHWAAQREERILLGTDWKEQGLVFPGTWGQPMHDAVLRAHFKRTLARAGLPTSIRFHDLRHSCASFLIVEKVHPRVIMKILGHSSINITMNIYGHIFDEQEGEALADVSDRLQSGYTPQDGSEDNAL